MAKHSQKMALLVALFNITLSLAAGTQFITGPCKSDSDCADSCCGFNTGLCAGPIVAQERDGGCGFGDAEPNDTAAVAIGFTGSAPSPNTSGSGRNVNAVTPPSTTLAAVIVPSATASTSSAKGTQFITGPCKSDSDCADSCCGFNTGLCAGPIIAQERDGGCGFGDAEPNDTAAVAIGFTGSAPSPNTSGSNLNAVTQPSTTLATVIVPSAVASAPSATGTQFDTGPCKSDSDCADSCCGFNTGLCAGAIVAQQRDGGCGFGDAQPNSIAAQKLGFTGGITG
ncbi:hypothetical protein D0Z07_7827 [Hyphodiscus hymeniophilus]|uniref:Biotrophy-associated secreted protein 2 n=1 Tax=Hyphodiscus hymeniophilus TaxID=353542 RepID=A0A9P6SLG2_9HELO|nr:hypothetical protein D0Z07_7827 [Hyphodiscus hymeniophilus]